MKLYILVCEKFLYKKIDKMPWNTIILIAYIVWALIVWWLIWYFGYKKSLTEKALKFKAKMAKAREMEEEIVEDARTKSKQILDRAEERAEKIEEQRLKKMEEIQERLMKREEKMDEKLERLEEEKWKVVEKQKDVEDILKQQIEKLAEVANLKEEDAKQVLFDKIENEYKSDMVSFIDKLKTIKKEEADTEAASIIAKSLPRIAADSVIEHSIKTVDLPNEDYKGKLIGREWRNISYFEKVTWVEVIVDDTPMVVRISSFDADKRFIASKTLERLVKDWRINPHYIEKHFNDVTANFDEILIEKWKEALTKVNLPMMKPEVVKYIGQFYLRFSYGQNLWSHSIEVAKIAEAIASELGLDTVLAKKAWLLHDIWKIVATNGESHAVVWADILRKLWMDAVIINAAESHHYDVPMTNPISRIVAAADAISGSRPWARFDTREMFVEKMTELEKLINGFDGVDKVHIMQAGREIMVYVEPDKVTDLQLEGLVKDIWKKIEDQLDYPGIIRVSCIREKKIIEFLR